jgi:hypothetical protein
MSGMRRRACVVAMGVWAPVAALAQPVIAVTVSAGARRRPTLRSAGIQPARVARRSLT